ncbi:hypothetical protein BT69DRAFT_1352407 [Atractiella rhizophila]|nr:hypothetical protein BT69DRAFT_1352407 [Atractiella rhizophila]
MPSKSHADQRRSKRKAIDASSPAADAEQEAPLAKKPRLDTTGATAQENGEEVHADASKRIGRESASLLHAPLTASFFSSTTSRSPKPSRVQVKGARQPIPDVKSSIEDAASRAPAPSTFTPSPSKKQAHLEVTADSPARSTRSGKNAVVSTEKEAKSPLKKAKERASEKNEQINKRENKMNGELRKSKRHPEEMAASQIITAQASTRSTRSKVAVPDDAVPENMEEADASGKRTKKKYAAAAPLDQPDISHRSPRRTKAESSSGSTPIVSTVSPKLVPSRSQSPTKRSSSFIPLTDLTSPNKRPHRLNDNATAPIVSIPATPSGRAATTVTSPFSDKKSPRKKPTPTKNNPRGSLSRLTRSKGVDTQPSTPEAPSATAITRVEEQAEEIEISATSENHSFPSTVALPFLEGILASLAGRSSALHDLPKQMKTTSELLDAPYLPGMKEDWERDVRWVLDRTVKYGEGNCVLLVGPRGVGKSLMVHRNLALLERLHGKDAYVVIKLNGLSETNDKLALKEIARQLKGNEGYLAAEVGGEGGENDWGDSFATYASTLQTLINILEPHKSANMTLPTEGEDSAGKTEEQTQPEGETKQKPIIFVLDEFDQFALQPRQSFLYCLLDCVQGRKRQGGMLVLGLSSRADCLNALEKRVKSRCQSRVHQITHDGGIEGMQAIAKWLLKPLSGKETSDELRKAWEVEVESFADSPAARTALEQAHAIDSSNRSRIITFLHPVISSLYHNTKVSGYLNLPCLATLPPLPFRTATDSITFLTGLTTPELCVLIASKHLTLSNHTLNLPILHNVYVTHSKRGLALKELTKVYSKNVFTKAFERLRELEILLPTTDAPVRAYELGSASLEEGFKMVRLAPWVQSVDKAVLDGRNVPESLKNWCRKWAS